MSVRVNKTIVINGVTIELADLIDHPWAFMDLLRTQFNESTFEKKSSETYENYLKRLFALLFYRQNKPNRSTRQARQNSTKEAVNNGLKFDIIRRNKCQSRIVFKQSGNQYRLKNEDLELLINAAKTKSINKLQVTDKLIGVELEFIGKYSKIEEFCSKMKNLVGESLFSATMQYCHNDGSKWILGEDGSVYPRRNDKEYSTDMRGFELTSPILKLSSKRDMKLLRDVCELVKFIFGAYTNGNCGTHVHMSFPVDKEDMKPVGCSLSENEFLCHFVRSYRKSEASLFDKLVPFYRRENRGHYCKTCNTSYMDSRYRKLNVKNFVPNTTYLHLEFRQLNGTLDADKIILWSKLQALFVDSTMKAWNIAKKKHEVLDVPQLKLEEVIVSDVFGIESSEQLMKMANMIK